MDIFNRDKKGKFANKSESERKVRSMRVADEIWEEAGDIASERGITRADLFEEMIKEHQVLHGKDGSLNILHEALRLKANAGGAIKRKIKEFLEILKAN